MRPGNAGFFRRAAQLAVVVFCAAAVLTSGTHHIAAHPCGQIAAPAQVHVERDPERGARSYTLAEGGCRWSWTVFDVAPNRGLIQNRSVCGRPLAEQMPALSRIVAAVLTDSNPSAAPHTLFWGRLTPDQGRDDLEMAFRLALAAHRSPSWDVARGRPRSGSMNAFVVRLANQAMIYSELKDLFRTCGLELKWADAEKVLVLSAGKLPFFERLKASGVRATEKLPFDCLTYFAISKRS
jgi:hypothetical protein